MIESWGSLIDALGGTNGVAAEFDLSASVVSGWRKRGIPATRWLGICALAERKGVPVNMEMLARFFEPAEVRP